MAVQTVVYGGVPIFLESRCTPFMEGCTPFVAKYVVAPSLVGFWLLECLDIVWRSGFGGGTG